MVLNSKANLKEKEVDGLKFTYQLGLFDLDEVVDIDECPELVADNFPENIYLAQSPLHMTNNASTRI